MVSAWRNFKNIFPRPLFIIIFRPEMLKFHPYSILTRDTRVEFVIYSVLTGLNIDWFKNYGLKCKWRPRACLANFQNIATDKWTFYYHIWPFFANCMVIFHKNEIQTVILMCLRSLNLNWYNCCDTKWKNAKNKKSVFLQNCKKPKMEIFTFFVITFEPIRF